ncbi:MAG: hypothetical protein JWO47_181 [Candidatus Saccharibacteria bacterium]|nr:hypothetical protein [Candidatus Saccharibacteria bacterium]
MNKTTPKRIIAFLIILLVIYILTGPMISKAMATSHLKQVSNREMQPLLEPINALMQGAEPRRVLECGEKSHTHIKTNLFCQDVNFYKYNPEALPDSSRSRIASEAAYLDKILAQNGWTIDRPQDEIKTIEGSIPTTALQRFYGGGQVPFHKNIGAISCNLEIWFGGPTDGISPGAVNVNRFSCQQHISYPMLHISNHINRSFGG